MKHYEVVAAIIEHDNKILCMQLVLCQDLVQVKMRFFSS